MRHFRPLLLSTFLGAGILATQVAPVFAQTCTCPPTQDQGAASPAGEGGVAVYADEAPPPLPDYDQPPIPAEGYFWTPGYWSWNGYEYFWVPGTWLEPPHPGLLWTPGYWAFVNGAYAFHRGYWGEHVGFYGGVAYGFGYVGVGFEGGRWDNGRFFYNRSVTNVGQVNITNVYEKQITVRENNRASFNGPNGLNVQPTPAELQAVKEKHVAPTHDQLDNARAASRNESAFVSTNKGKPSIAATAKPGQFTGAAVVPAKAAGGPPPAPGAGTGTPEPKGSATPESTKTPVEMKPGGPTPEATKATPQNKLEPLKAEPTKGETPKPEPTKALPEKKLEQPKPEPTKAGPANPEPMNGRPARPEATKAQPLKVEQPKPQPMNAAPQNTPQQRKLEPANINPPEGKPTGGKPGAGCGQPGEPACPK